MKKAPLKKQSKSSNKRPITTGTSRGGSGGGNSLSGVDLISKLVEIKFPDDEKYYSALVVGFRDGPGKSRAHKVFYIEEGSQEVLDLRQRTWRLDKKQHPEWRRTKEVGQRIAVDLQVGYYKFRKIRVAFEAYVVRHKETTQFELYYPHTNQLETRNLEDHIDFPWAEINNDAMHFDGRPLVTWSFFRAPAVPDHFKQPQMKRAPPSALVRSSRNKYRKADEEGKQAVIMDVE